MTKKSQKKEMEMERREPVSEDPIFVPEESEQELEKAILEALPAIKLLLSLK